MSHEEQLYKKGFNAGYLIAQYEPKLLGKLEGQVRTSNEFLLGVTEGAREFRLEISKQQITELNNIRVSRDKNERDFDRN